MLGSTLSPCCVGESMRLETSYLWHLFIYVFFVHSVRSTPRTIYAAYSPRTCILFSPSTGKHWMRNYFSSSFMQHIHFSLLHPCHTNLDCHRSLLVCIEVILLTNPTLYLDLWLPFDFTYVIPLFY